MITKFITLNQTFGQFVKSKRVELGKTLRELCIQNQLDPSYMSKLERRRLTPPQNKHTLTTLANALKLNELDSITLEELAINEKDYIPQPLTDEQLLLRLPVPHFLGMLNENNAKKLVEIIRMA